MKHLVNMASKIFTAQLISQIVAFLVNIIIIRSLGLKEYGYYAVMTATYAALTAIVSFRFSEAFLKAVSSISVDSQEFLLFVKKTMFGELITRIIISLLFPMAFYFLFKEQFRSITLVAMFFLCLEQVLLFLSSIFNSICRINKKINNITKTIIVTSLFKLIVFFMCFYFFTITIEMVCFLSALSSLIAFILHLFFVGESVSNSLINKLEKSNHYKVIYNDYLIILKAGWISSAISSIIKQGDVLYIGYFWGPVAAAPYKLARSLFTVYSSFFLNLSQLSFYDSAKMIDNNNAVRFFIKQSKVLLPYFLVVSTLLTIILYFIIPLVYGVQYDSASTLLGIMIVGATINGVLFWCQNYLIIKSNYKIYIVSQVINSTICFFMYIILGYYFHVYGVAIAFSVAWALVQVIPLICILLKLNHHE